MMLFDNLLRGSMERQIAARLRTEFRRCGWEPDTLKVHAITSRSASTKIYVLNVGYLRGLDSGRALVALKNLPERCGARRIMSALTRLEDTLDA